MQILPLALFTLTSTARPARAQTHREKHHRPARPSDRNRDRDRDPAPDPDARALAEQGFAAYDRKDYAAAIQLFARANQLAPAPGLLYNIAQSYRQLGTAGCAPALEYYRRYLDALTARGQDGPESVRARIVEMKTCVEAHDGAPARGTGAPPDRPTEPRDPDASPGPAPDGRPAPLSPRPTAAGGHAARAPVVTTPSPPDRDTRARRRAGWIVVGAGGVALATAAVTGILALERESSLSSRCDATVCPPTLSSDVAGYNHLRIAAAVSGTIGVAAVATGAWLLLSAHRDEAPPPSAHARAERHVTPWFAGHSAGLSWTF